MAKTYHKPTPELTELVERIMEEHHDDLTALRVKVGCRFVIATGGLKLHGYPCAAMVQIVSYEKRFQGFPDAMITVDKIEWDDLDDDERAAVIDHELEHLAISRDKHGQPRTDDLGRPKLKMRLHDVQLGVFDSVIRRHGDAALDTQVVRACHERYRQMSLQWGDDMGPQTDPTEGGPVEVDVATMKRLGSKARGGKNDAPDAA